jgi:UDP-N-acetylglucosamine 1-carboxyvinyltransferase
VQGAKNSVLKLMAAALLARGTTTITNVPDILDVEIMSELLRRLGCDVSHDAPSGVVVITVPERPHHRADYDLVRRMRASICVLGPLVSRCGEADVAMPVTTSDRAAWICISTGSNVWGLTLSTSMVT